MVKMCMVVTCRATRRDRCRCSPGTPGSLKECPVNPRLQTKKRKIDTLTNANKEDESKQDEPKAESLQNERDEQIEDEKKNGDKKGQRLTN